MKNYRELIFYVSVGAGMALATSSFTMVSGIFEIVSGLWAVVAICLAGLFCILISSSIAELASMYPSSPGIRTYLKVAFGDKISLFLVHLYLIFIVLIAGVESYVFALVITAILPNISPLVVVLSLLTLVIFTNLLGLELPRLMQIGTALTLIISILCLGINGFFSSAAGIGEVLSFDFSNNFQQLELLPAATAMAVFLFIGFEWVTPLGFRPSSYERKIPMSMPIAITTNMVTYSFFVIGISSQLTPDRISAVSVPQVPYLVEMFGPSGVYFAGGISLLATFSTFNAGIMGSSRLVYALSREGKLPKWCSKISLRTTAPVGAIILIGGLSLVSSIIVVTYQLELLAAIIGSSIICFVYAAFMLAVIRLRKSQPGLRRPYRTPVFAWLQWLLILIVPMIGIQSLFSQPTMPLQPALGMVVFITIAFVLTRWSLEISKNMK